MLLQDKTRTQLQFFWTVCTAGFPSSTSSPSFAPPLTFKSRAPIILYGTITCLFRPAARTMNREQTEGKEFSLDCCDHCSIVWYVLSPVLFRSQGFRATSNGLRGSCQAKIHQVERWAPIRKSSRGVNIYVLLQVWWSWYCCGSDYQYGDGGRTRLNTYATPSPPVF